jgi:hypothetical protein
MSASTLAAPATASADKSDDERHGERQDELHSRVMRAIATSDAFADVPNESELWLLPDGDPDHVAWVLRAATEAPIPGRNLYLRWVHPDDLPSLPVERNPAAPVRRVEYQSDGSVARVQIPNGDGWRDVEPDLADRANVSPSAKG